MIDRISLTTKEPVSGTTHILKKFHHYTFLKIKDVIKVSLSSIKIKYFLLIHCHDVYDWDTAVPRGSDISQNVLQLNPNEDKHYLLTPYPTLTPSLKKFSAESIRAIALNPNINLQSIGFYSRSDIQHHIRTQQFHELLTQMDTTQRQLIDQNLQKVAETAVFSDIYAQDYSGDFKDNKDYVYPNGEIYRLQNISKRRVLV